MKGKFSKKEWLSLIDDQVREQAEIKRETSTGKPELIRFTPTTGFIAYHIAQKYADWTTGKGVYCSQIKMAKEFNMSSRTVRQAFQLLEGLGFMVRDPHRSTVGGTNYYDLEMPNLGSENSTLSSEDSPLVPENLGVGSENSQTTNKQLSIKEVNNEDGPAKPGSIKVIGLNILDPKGKEKFGASRRAASVSPSFSLTDVYILDPTGVLKMQTRNKGVSSEDSGYLGSEEVAVVKIDNRKEEIRAHVQKIVDERTINLNSTKRHGRVVEIMGKTKDLEGTPLEVAEQAAKMCGLGLTDIEW
jgi:hypothetical protein